MTRSFPKLSLFVVTLALLLNFSASSTRASDFKQVIEQARESDQILREARSDYRAALETQPQSRAALLPQVSVDANTGTTRSEITGSSNLITPDSTATINSWGYALTLNQILFDRELFKQFSASNALVAQARFIYEAARQNLVVRVAEAYFNVLGAIDNQQYARAEKDAIGRQLEQSQKRFEVGLNAITDVKEAQARYDVANASEIAADNLLANATEALRVLTGTDPGELNRLVENMPLVGPEPQNIEAWVSAARDNNHALSASEFGVEAARESANSSKGGHWPALNLQLKHDFRNTDDSIFASGGGSDQENTSAFVNLSIPIYSGGLTSSRVREALSLYEKAMAQRDLQLRRTVQQTRDAFLGVRSSISRVLAYKQALASNESALEATQAGFDVGTRTAVDVLVSLRAKYGAERDYARSRYDYILNLLRLKQAAGAISADDVKMINRWLVTTQ